MKVLIVDDERLARLRLRKLLGQLAPEVEVVEARSAELAFERIAEGGVDLLLLDIQMPGMDGMSLARRPGLPPIVFTTAHAQFAAEAFDVEAIDYLLKPVARQRLQRALQRARSAGRPASLVARDRDGVHLFDPSEIERFHARDKYVAFEHGGREYLLDRTLSDLEGDLAPHGFVRCHRAELIHAPSVRRLQRDGRGGVAVLESGARARVSRRAYGELQRRLVGDAEAESDPDSDSDSAPGS
ncbi:MAG: LytTR family DNA-binding domain-containing protein [Myxococcales bacterium]|jgi:DNA-binding LytR/AlgR family response regulator